MRRAAMINTNFSLSNAKTEENEEEPYDDGTTDDGSMGEAPLNLKQGRQTSADTTNVGTKGRHQMRFHATPTYGAGPQMKTCERDDDSSLGLIGNSCCENAVARLKHEMFEVLKNEFTCCICEEIVMKATVTKCSHMFCAFCLQESKRIRKTCPMCRAQRILERPARSVDEYIDKMVKLISEDVFDRRLAMMQERDAIRLRKATRCSTRRSAGLSRMIVE